MLDGLSTLAIVPKAKAIAARRLTKNEYEALARKRSVIEVTAALLVLCDIERSNIINIIEGVRYGLSPDDIAAFLKY